MTVPRTHVVVSAAFAHTADVQAWQVAVTREERERIERTMRNLFELGHLAAFSVQPRESGIHPQALIAEFRTRFGAVAVDSCLAESAFPISPSPSFLMPIWAFDHVVDGAPAATGRLLGSEMELIATPCPDEEQGAHLPGRSGRWLIHARPLF